MNRRQTLALLLTASAWTEAVVSVNSQTPPRLRMAFGGERGFSGLDVEVNGELFTVTPEELATGLRADRERQELKR